MHHGAIIRGENRSRIIDDGDREFGLWPTSVRTHAADGKVPLCR